MIACMLKQTALVLVRCIYCNKLATECTFNVSIVSVEWCTLTCVTSLKLPCPKQPLLPLPNVMIMPLSAN